jgi:transcriptional regulator with XRE-family HTH domain
MSFGQIIADARRKLGISQKDLAKRIRKKEDGEPISPQYLNDIERDRRNPPSELLISQFAQELKVSKNYLMAAAGTLPEEFRRLVKDSDPEEVDRAFQVFRRQMK